MRDVVDAPSCLPLAIRDLAFTVAGKILLQDVSFVLPQGGVTALIGPNGAGKSLTLRLCHGLITPSSGSVTWNAADTTAKHRHAMVFQRPVMLRRSVRDNIAHAVKALHRPDPVRRVAEALHRFDLVRLADQPARSLSGGEQQRLAIARAFALSPEVLFLDEPTSQLDPATTRQIEAMIEVLRAEGITVLMTTHDLPQARRLSQRVLFMHKGRLVEDAPTDQFFTRPATEEARIFLSGALLT